MPDTRISDLTAASTLTGTEEFPCSDGTGTTKAATANQLRAHALAAGSATAGSWPVLGSGTLQTIPDAGSLERDSECMYGTTDGGNRGVIPLMHVIRADSDRTLTSTTSAQAIFGTPSNGRLTLETGTYIIDGVIHLNTMSGTSGNAQFGLLGAGGATLGTQLVHLVGVDGAAGTAATQTGSTIQGGNTSPGSAMTAGTGTAMTINVTGTFEVTAAGTIVPSIALLTAAAAVLKAGSYLRIHRIGSTGMTHVGQWD